MNNHTLEEYKVLGEKFKELELLLNKIETLIEHINRYLPDDRYNGETGKAIEYQLKLKFNLNLEKVKESLLIQMLQDGHFPNVTEMFSKEVINND